MDGASLTELYLAVTLQESRSYVISIPLGSGLGKFKLSFSVVNFKDHKKMLSWTSSFLCWPSAMFGVFFSLVHVHCFVLLFRFGI